MKAIGIDLLFVGDDKYKPADGDEVTNDRILAAVIGRDPRVVNGVYFPLLDPVAGDRPEGQSLDPLRGQWLRFTAPLPENVELIRTVEANFERWLGQFERPAGVEPARGELAANGLAVHWIDVAGTLLPSGMGMGPTTPQPGSRLLGAVVEGEGGPWFFKLTGPDATVVAVRDPFLALLRSLRPAGLTA